MKKSKKLALMLITVLAVSCTVPAEAIMSSFMQTGISYWNALRTSCCQTLSNSCIMKAIYNNPRTACAVAAAGILATVWYTATKNNDSADHTNNRNNEDSRTRSESTSSSSSSSSSSSFPTKTPATPDSHVLDDEESPASSSSTIPTSSTHDRLIELQAIALRIDATLPNPNNEDSSLSDEDKSDELDDLKSSVNELGRVITSRAFFKKQPVDPLNDWQERKSLPQEVQALLADLTIDEIENIEVYCIQTHSGTYTYDYLLPDAFEPEKQELLQRLLDTQKRVRLFTQCISSLKK